ncbi:MAG: hypothetical protein LBL42_04485 [Tannerella sp.]|jgi:hypothetical protein|nr:hypothetical protein [Tannerella sp.]
MEELLIYYFAGILPDREKAVLFRQPERDNARKARYVHRQNRMAVSGRVDRAGDERLTAESFRRRGHSSGRC